MRTITKTLSANDTAETGGHQAGILVPKDPRILNFFPSLDKSKKNPRQLIKFHDESGSAWEFAFIYYNNRYFGGTRNEYRLTRMTKYIRGANLVAGDELIFERVNGDYRIGYQRQANAYSHDKVLKLGSSWKVVQL